MSDPIHLRPSDARVVPWRNGRGVTRELALWPAGARFEGNDFDWRISRASVEEDGPFSSFPGLERVLVVTAGAGLRLDHGQAAPQARLEHLVPYRFSGDWPADARLVDGRVEDFNVLCLRGVVRAEVEVWHGLVDRTLRVAGDAQLFLHVLEGALEARDASLAGSWTLAGGESLWFTAPTARTLTLAGSCNALLVRLASG